MDEHDDLDDYIDYLINAEYVKLIEGDIGLCTCQLFKHDSANITPFASGVFTFLGENFYLLTASHVIENWPDSDKLFIKVKDDYISIVGKGCGSEINKEDKIDIAYIKLKPELVALLGQWYRFLPYTRFLFHSKICEEPNYCAFGYPVINKKKEIDGLKTFGTAYYMKILPDKVFEHYKFNPLTHYILSLEVKQSILKLEKLINLKQNIMVSVVEDYGI